MLAERHLRHDPPTSPELSAARADAERALKLGLELPTKIALATGGSARLDALHSAIGLPISPPS